jgi:hypothetical protein
VAVRDNRQALYGERARRKEDQEWEMAGLARRDGDMKAAERHTERARLWAQGIDPDAETEK